MNKQYKSAQAGIISVVLLILIGFVIAVIIFNFSNSFIKKQKAETSGFSYYYDAELVVLSELGSASLFGLGGLENALLGVRRKDNEGNVTGVRFIFENDKGSSYSYDSLDAPNEAGVFKPYEINSTDIGISGNISKISLMLLYGNNKPTSVLDEVEFYN